MKSYIFAVWKGYEFVQGPNGTLQKAFEDGMITDHDGWRRMAKARVTTLHTYNEGDAIGIVRNRNIYIRNILVCCISWMINLMKKSYGLK